MFKFCDCFLFLCILVVGMHFVLAKEANKPEHANSKGLSSSVNHMEGDIDEHIAARKWRENDEHARQMCEKLYDKILPYLSNSSNDLDLSPGCKRALMKTLIGVKKYKLWAFKMLDSSGKIPSGILNLDAISMGNYDECLEIDVSGNFRGQYCTVVITHPLPERERFTMPFRPVREFENLSRSVSEDSVTAELYRTSNMFYSGGLRIGVCTPSTCSNYEIEKLTNKVIESFKMNVDVHVPNCEVLEETFQFRAGEIAILSVLGTLLFIGITSTIVDVYLKLTTAEGHYQDNVGLATKYLLCFSFYTNSRRLLTPDTSPDSIKVFHGMRVFSMLWIIFGHSYELHVFNVFSSTKTLLGYINDISFSFVLQGLMSVDAFFFMSSVLHSYGIIKLGDKKINYALHVFKRITRILIPSLFILVSVFLVPYLGSGPAWKDTMDKFLTGKCRSQWWKYVLLINNFSAIEDTCLDFTWYISADTHLFLLSLLVVIPMRRNPRRAFLMNLLLLLGGISLSIFFGYYRGTTKLLVLTNSHIDDITYVAVTDYFATYGHITSCCVGLIIGYFLAKRSNILKIPLKVNLSLWLSSFAAFIIVIYGPYNWNRGYFPNVVLCVLYKSTKGLWWCLALGWVTIACQTGNGGFIKDILSWPAFVPLSRLTYMVYLTHKIILYMYFGSTRSPIAMTHRTLVFIFLATVLMSYMCAYVLGLLFESPFTALQNLMFSLYLSKDSNMYKSLKDTKNDIADVPQDSFNDHVSMQKGDLAIKMEEKKADNYGTMEYRKFE